MKKIVNLNQFRRKEPQTKPEPDPSLASVDEPKQPLLPPAQDAQAEPKISSPKLTKPAQDFRLRFKKALGELKAEALEELAKAQTREEFKRRINVSLVLKRAKSSPLTAYSPLHRDTLFPLVEQANIQLDAAVMDKFSGKSRQRRETLSATIAELTTKKALFEAQLSKLASQKLSQYLGQ